DGDREAPPGDDVEGVSGRSLLDHPLPRAPFAGPQAHGELLDDLGGLVAEELGAAEQGRARLDRPGCHGRLAHLHAATGVGELETLAAQAVPEAGVELVADHLAVEVLGDP